MARHFTWGLGILAAAGGGGVAILAIVLLWPGTQHSRESIPQSGIDRGGSEPMTTFRLTSAAFTKGGGIPVKHTCDGDDISPPLSWDGVPENAQSLALIMDDPDAPDPDAPRVTWVHWVLYNIPTSVAVISEGVTVAQLPQGARQGQNDWKRTGYGGPCPPIGRHRYFLKLYALDVMLPEMQRPTKAEIEAAMEGHVVARAELVGTYQRPG